MFKLLRKKTYLWIAGFLLISMALTFFVVYSAYTSLLTKDFLKKQKFLAMQTAQTLQDYLLSLEEQINLLINKNQVSLNLAETNYLSLNNIHFDNMDFSQIKIYYADQVFTIFTAITNDSPSGKDLSVSEIKDITDGLDAIWYTFTYSVDTQINTELLYVKRIIHGRETVGYLTASVVSTTLERILSLSDESYTSRGNQLFADYSAAAIQLPSGLYQCSVNPIDPHFASTLALAEDNIYGNSYQLQCELGIQDMTLILQGNAEHFQSYLIFIHRILIVAYIIIAILMIIFLYLFTLKIDATINKLYDKMKLDSAKEPLK